MDANKYKILEKEFEDLIKITSFINSSIDVEQINHYLKYSEIEMAYEIFCTEIIEHDIKLDLSIFQRLLNLGESLNMEECSVYDDEFWQRLIGFINKEGLKRI